MGAVQFEPCSEALVAKLFTDPEKCSVIGLPGGWNSLSLLEVVGAVAAGTRKAADASSLSRHGPEMQSFARTLSAFPGIRAVIDCGALVADCSNSEAARALARAGSERFSHGAYAREDGRVMAVDAGTGEPCPLSECNIGLSERITFYDQSHCVGCDVPQEPAAVAVVTVSKDTTLSEFTQAAWRMRKIEHGQRLVVVLPPEVRELVRALGFETAGTFELFVWLCSKQARWDRVERSRLELLRVRTLTREAVLRLAFGGDRKVDVASSFMDTMPGFEDEAAAPAEAVEKLVERAPGWFRATWRVPGRRAMLDQIAKCEPYMSEEWQWRELAEQLGSDAGDESTHELDVEAEAERDQEQEAAVEVEMDTSDGKRVLFPGKRSPAQRWPLARFEETMTPIDAVAEICHEDSIRFPPCRVWLSKNHTRTGMLRGRGVHFALRRETSWLVVTLAEAASLAWYEQVYGLPEGMVLVNLEESAPLSKEGAAMMILGGRVPSQRSPLRRHADELLAGLSASERQMLVHAIQERLAHDDEHLPGLLG